MPVALAEPGGTRIKMSAVKHFRAFGNCLFAVMCNR